MRALHRDFVLSRDKIDVWFCWGRLVDGGCVVEFGDDGHGGPPLG